MKKDEPERKKVFFITSNQTKLDKFIEYEIPKNRGLINLKAGYNNSEFKKEMKYKNQIFSVYINSFEIELENLNEEDQDPKTKTYKITIFLRYNKNRFPGYINLRESKNNFIYDFKFNEFKAWAKIYVPPPQINFSHLEQLKIYDEYLDKVLKKEKSEEIYADLVSDSQSLYFNKKLDLDYILEIFKICYNEKTVILFLKSFKLENIILPTNFLYEEYEPMLKLIENDFNLITRHCSEKEDKFEYYIIFYTLLLFVRYKYEKDKAIEMINDKNLWEYFIKILPDKYKFFNEIIIPNELLDKMFEQDLNSRIIIGILSLCCSVEKILIVINSKLEIISNCYLKEKELIIMSNLAYPKKEDNLDNIIAEIEKIIKFESDNDKIFIAFDESFWQYYLHFIDDYKKLYKLKKIIILCANVDKKLLKVNLRVNEKLHSSFLDSIKAGTLKNEEMIEFITYDIYFIDNKFSSSFYRPLDIVDGIDFETMSDYFFDKWNSSNIFKIYSFAGDELKCRIIDKLNDMKYFGKLLKLFNYKDKNIFDYKLVQKLREKFKNLSPLFKPESCPNFIKDIAYFIYIIDYQNMYDMKIFLTGTIDKYIFTQNIKIDIYIYLLTNYKDISSKIKDAIIDYLILNKKLLNANGILILLENIKSQKIIESLSNKIESFSIKEEELFSQEKDIESFILSDGIQKKSLFDKISCVNKYLLNLLMIKDNVMKLIKNGEIKYNLFKICYINDGNRTIFKEKLRILFFNNKEDIEECFEILKQRFNNITKIIARINRLISILKNFFSETQKNNIRKIEKLFNLIKDGNMNEIEKPEVKKELDDINNIFSKDDFEKFDNLKNSLFFMQLFESEKLNTNPKNENEFLEKVEADFNKLKVLFEKEKWYDEVPEIIIKQCCKSLRNKEDKILTRELKHLIKVFFKIDNCKNIYLEKFEKTIKLYEQKEEMIIIANSCKFLIEELKINKTEFYKELENISKSLLTNKSLEETEKYVEDFAKFGINIINPKEEDKKYLNILYCIYENKDPIKYIIKLDIPLLREMLSEKNDIFEENSEIKEISECFNFIHKLKDISLKNDKELIQAFINEAHKIKNIDNLFLNYIKYFIKIKKLVSQLLYLTAVKENKIRNMMKLAQFYLTYDCYKDPCVRFEGEYIDEENIKKTIYYYELIELSDISLLPRKPNDENEQEEEQIFEIFKNFCNIVNEIDKIKQILEKIEQKGYSENIKFIIEINNNILSYCIDCRYIKNFIGCYEFLDNILQKITNTQIYYYKNEELIRYIYGKQINLFSSCLRREQNFQRLIPLLKFLANDKGDYVKIFEDFNYNYELDEDKYITLLENIKISLKNILDKNNLNLEVIYKQNLIKEKYKEKFKGLFLYNLKNDYFLEEQKDIEIQLLNLFNYFTGYSPMAQTILLCNEETSCEEITAFIYRAFLCKYPVFFAFGKIECLTSEKKKILIELINSLYNDNLNQMKSCVVFAYSDKNDSLVEYLNKLEGCKNLVFDNINEENQLFDQNVEIVTSNRDGIGTSTQIKLKIMKENKKYIYFPFGGESTRYDIIARLKKLQEKIKDEENIVIHLDLYDSQQTELMKEFLFSFLITKFYGQNEDLFYLPKKIKIIVEIPYGFNSLFKKYPLLSMFKNRIEKKDENLPPLIIQKEVNSNIQIVCNYLKLLKSGKLSEKDLIIEGISLLKDDIKEIINDDIIKEDTTIDAVPLDEKECETLIRDVFKNKLKIEYPSYYQINLFINILAGQLKKFSINFTLTAANLIQTGILLKNPTLKNVRELIVNSFILNIKNFAFDYFHPILRAEQETNEIKIDPYIDENKKEEKIIKVISELKDNFSCDKINPCLVLFNNGNEQNFTIISINDSNEKEYEQLLQLQKSIIMSYNEEYECYGLNHLKAPTPIELKNYRKFKQDDFLKEIKEILSLKNPVYNCDKNSYPRLKSIEEIVGDYVFTPDNFLKMILILLRERENIPVILMGETGCGKTSLIKKLYELMNNGENNMEILNMHAGFTTRDIIDFLSEEKIIDGRRVESIITKAKNLEEKEERIKKDYYERGQVYTTKKLWVFLMELILQVVA